MFAALGAKTLAILLAVALCFGVGFAVRGHYAAKAMAEHLEDDHKADDARLKAVAAKDADTARREKEAANANDTQRAAAVAAAASQAADDQRRTDDLRFGRVSARVRIVAGTCSDPASGVSPGLPSTGADDASTAQLAPETAAGLERIADTGNAAIRQLAELQAWVDRNVRAVNAGQSVNAAGSVPSGEQPAGVTTP